MTAGWFFSRVDTVCINQENLGEKAEQIAMMFTIFRKARKVLAWLGHFLDVPVAKLCLAVAAREIRRITPSQDMIAAAAKVVEHQWFSRCWIMQEVAGCPRATSAHQPPCTTIQGLR